MLQTIREYTQGWISGTIISVIILSFSLWGIHSYFTGNANSNELVEVNGVGISKQQLSMAYERLRRSSSIKDEAVLKTQALQGLVEFEVLKQAALDQGFQVYSNQINQYLENMPEFQVNNQFSLDRFQQVLAASSLSTNDFFEIIKSNLIIDQPRLGILLSSFSLPNETTYIASLVNQERDVAYKLISINDFLAKPIIISQEAIKDYYNQHQADFMTPEKISVEYIQLSKKDDKFADQREQLANITYERPETLKNAATELNLPIQTSAVFTKDKGTNDISQYQSVREVAFSKDVLVSQNNSDVIQLTPDSVVVLRIKTHQVPALLPLDQVSKDIIEKLKLIEAQKQASAYADKLKQQLEQGASPVGFAQTGLIGRYSNKIDPELVKLAFQLPKNTYGVTYSKKLNSYAVVGVNAIKPGELNPKDAPVFAEQEQASEGVLEYELYKQSQMKNAKIKQY